MRSINTVYCHLLTAVEKFNCFIIDEKKEGGAFINIFSYRPICYYEYNNPTLKNSFACNFRDSMLNQNYIYIKRTDSKRFVKEWICNKTFYYDAVKLNFFIHCKNDIHVRDNNAKLSRTKNYLINKKVHNALSYIEANSHRTLTLESIAAASFCSVRTLQRAFKRNINTSPMKYLKEQRILAFHKALLISKPDETVTTIAFKLGFTHLGQLAIDYKKIYGTHPSAVLYRVRKSRMSRF